MSLARCPDECQPCPRCDAMRAAALQVDGAWDVLHLQAPEIAAFLQEEAPQLFAAVEALVQEVERGA